MELHLSLAAAIPNSLIVEYIPSLDRVLTKPLEPVDGYFVPSEEPGLGVPFDAEKLREFKVDDENR
jgi:L-alanine-DL-glutamate epimerase-like enolase superfamily enzyme